MFEFMKFQGDLLYREEKQLRGWDLTPGPVKWARDLGYGI